MLCSSSGSSSNGVISVQQIPTGEAQMNDIALNHSGNILYTASSDRVRVWDVRKWVGLNFTIINNITTYYNDTILTDMFVTQTLIKSVLVGLRWRGSWVVGIRRQSCVWQSASWALTRTSSSPVPRTTTSRCCQLRENLMVEAMNLLASSSLSINIFCCTLEYSLDTLKFAEFDNKLESLPQRE